jgi:hypothetical protein
MKTMDSIDNPVYKKIKGFLTKKLEKINNKSSRIVKLRDGIAGEDLYIITGLNSDNDFNVWDCNFLNFEGSVYGVEWNNNWDGWDLIKSDNKAEIIENLADFILGYLKVSKRADEAGYYLANHINEGASNYIFSHSMGTRAAYTFLKYCVDQNTNNQIMLFNGAAPCSKTFFNYSHYSPNALKGMINFYNYSDPVLAVLALIRAPILKILDNLEFFGNNEAEQFSEPIGLQETSTVSCNINLNKIQGVEHSINSVLQKVIDFDLCEKRFIPRIIE